MDYKDKTQKDSVMVELSNEEALLFTLFLKYHSLFVVMNNNNILDTIGGSVTFHFDSDGNLRKIDRNTIISLDKKR